MAELSRRAGVSRETIHFYLREGLLETPRKTSRNMAWYDEGHLQRILLIRRLQQEKFLPLGVIKNLLRDGRALSTDGDVDFFADLITLDARTGARAGPGALDPAKAARATELAVERGLLRGHAGAREPSEQRVLLAVAEALELAADAREFALADMDVCAPHLERLVRDETRVLVERMLGSGDLPGSLGAFRASRGAVGRFIRAYRASLVHRIVEEALGELDRAAHQHIDALATPLGAGCRTALGLEAERARLGRPTTLDGLRARARLELGVGDLSTLATVLEGAPLDDDPELALYAALCLLRAGDGARARELVSAAMQRVPAGSPYVAALAGTLGLVVLVGHGAEFPGSRIANAARPLRLLDEALAGQERASRRDRAFVLYLAGRAFLALPPIAGRATGARTHLEALLALLGDATTLESAGDALHLRVNAHLLLAGALRDSDPAGAAAHETRARALDPDAGR